MSSHNNDGVHLLLMELYRASSEAENLIDSIPNVETAAVEHSASRLRALRDLLFSMEDEQTSDEKKKEMMDYLNNLIVTLDNFVESQEVGDLAPEIPLHHEQQGRGRKAYDLDLQAAQGLHNLGVSWKVIAHAMGVSRRTIYRHMRRAGLATSPRLHTAISDEELDRLVQQIHEEHPFVGCRIVKGHLESRGVHVARLRIQDSLRRVDAIGVLLR